MKQSCDARTDLERVRDKAGVTEVKLSTGGGHQESLIRRQLPREHAAGGLDYLTMTISGLLNY